MKILKSILALTLVLGGLFTVNFSCKKDTTTLKTLDGKFVGHSNLPNDNTDYYLSFVFASNHTFEVHDDQNQPNLVTGTGTWALNGSTLTGEFSYTANSNTVYSYTATFDTKTGLISAGTWGFSPNTSGLATWTMTKQ
ncbi:MAG: hypothetical protein ACKOWL_01300 [Sphingobacteriaceae bacterium]